MPLLNFPFVQEGDLVFGVVAAIEEEKDPRCLLLAFELTEQLSRLYPDPDGPVGSCVEELFDVVSRYFPISFNPVSGNECYQTVRWKIDVSISHIQKVCIGGSWRFSCLLASASACKILLKDQDVLGL